MEKSLSCLRHKKRRTNVNKHLPGAFSVYLMTKFHTNLGSAEMNYGAFLIRRNFIRDSSVRTRSQTTVYGIRTRAKRPGALWHRGALDVSRSVIPKAV